MAVIVFTGLFEKNCVYWLPFAWLLLENSINCVGLSCLSIAGLLPLHIHPVQTDAAAISG